MKYINTVCTTKSHKGPRQGGAGGTMPRGGTFRGGGTLGEKKK